MSIINKLRHGIRSWSPVCNPCHNRCIWISHPRNSKTHYQTLGLSASASKSEIKKAYYDLSMKFHPDKQQGNDEKFREITTAYEVLGNPRLRRLYDRGILSDEPPDASVHYPSGHGTSEFTSEEQSEKTRQTVRSFDRWAQSHYTETFNRQQYDKQMYELKKQKSTSAKSEAGADKLMGLVIVVFFMLSVYFMGTSSNRKDDPKKS